MWMGLNIVPHPLAREIRTEFKVSRWATRDKKRKCWRVMRVEVNRPCALKVGNTLFMHPDLIAHLPQQIANRKAERNEF